KLAQSLPKNLKEINIWIKLNSEYKSVLLLDDLYYFFNNLNFKYSYMNIEIVHSY
ncbi:9974_t:CDS:1, partial [Scutellospora calospora]